MVVVRVGQHHVGHRVGRHAVGLELLAQLLAHAEGAHVDEDGAAFAAQQGHGAPAQAAVADRAAGKALHEYVECVHG
jgi:hypothetical protein